MYVRCLPFLYFINVHKFDNGIKMSEFNWIRIAKELGFVLVKYKIDAYTLNYD